MWRSNTQTLVTISKNSSWQGVDQDLQGFLCSLLKWGISWGCSIVMWVCESEGQIRIYACFHTQPPSKMLKDAGKAVSKSRI